ncbi:MAG: HupE/UreJ family protein, partial [Thermoanaerobaculia bacterium]|nr:HupE/UreJ family protein [Thermoanaerobaculia bacterium]
DRALAEALAAMEPADLERRLEQLRSLLARRLRVRFDGEPADFAVGFPEAGRRRAADQAPSYLGLVARLDGAVPPGAAEVSFMASRAFPPVQLTILDQRALSGIRLPLQRGEQSPPYRLGSGARSEPLADVGRYLALGFWHILPAGLDHILFVLGLFLLSPRWRPLLWQVSAFTVAHTATLALATLGLVSLSPTIIEPLIALSIAYVGIENLLTRELRPWRVALVFGFGLLHGLGFAGVLTEVGLPEGELVAALLAFNAGVELGQLAVLGAAFALLGALLARPWYRSRVALPASAAIAVTGLWWAAVRLAGP